MDNAWKADLRADASAFGVALDAGQVDALAAHADLLLRWNGKLNLTRIAEPGEVRIKHVVDSLAALRVVPVGVRTVLDIGAGGGFPGIPWRIARPELDLVMVDAVAKKVAFLKSALAALRLPGRAVHARLAGDPERERVPPVDLVASRAFTALGPFLSLSRAYLKTDGCAVALLGPRDGEEDAQRAAAESGFELAQFCAYELPREMGRRSAARFVPRGTSAS